MTQEWASTSFSGRLDVVQDIFPELSARLTEATIKCSERCLYQSAKWAAELLNSLPQEDVEVEDDDSHMLNADPPVSSHGTFTTSYEDPTEAALEAKEGPKYLLAKSFFDTKEYDRCAAVFLPLDIPAGGLQAFEKGQSRTPVSSLRAKGKAKHSGGVQKSPFPRLSQKSLFLALYARYIAGEKRRDEETEMVLGPADGGHTPNRELPALARGLEGYFQAAQIIDPQARRSQGWLEYLYGIVLARSGQETDAQQWLLRSARTNPFHWGAWEELAALLNSVDDLSAQLTSLPPTIMTFLYSTHASVGLFPTSDANSTFTNLTSLLQYFPLSTFVQTQIAMSHYHNKDFESAAPIFQELVTSHPYRIDALDHYSNILYVMNDRPKLAFLAHLATSVDKFRPETCCVVGNYYSLCSQHEKAVMYFRRALTLDRTFLSAWTLMGHEYIELKNTHAAIESYRRAVDVNRKDYRAWYGLGQAYEVLDMGFYALYYYQRAAGLRPYDAKMWQAVGSCYAKMDRPEQAIKALKRALIASTYYETDSPGASFKSTVSGTSEIKTKGKTTGRKLLDPETLFQIASLYERLGNEVEAAKMMEVCVNQETGAGLENVIKAENRREKRLRKQALTEERARERSQQAHRGEEVEHDDMGDGDTEILSSSSSDELTPPEISEDVDGVHGDGFGIGTTATTSKARLWLARWALRHGELERAERLAEELCMDGYEVEEAKGLVREVRGRREGMAGNTAKSG